LRDEELVLGEVLVLLAFLQRGATGEEICSAAVDGGGSRSGRIRRLLEAVEAGEDKLTLFDFGLVGGTFGRDLRAAESCSCGL